MTKEYGYKFVFSDGSESRVYMTAISERGAKATATRAFNTAGEPASIAQLVVVHGEPGAFAVVAIRPVQGGLFEEWQAPASEAEAVPAEVAPADAPPPAAPLLLTLYRAGGVVLSRLYNDTDHRPAESLADIARKYLFAHCGADSLTITDPRTGLTVYPRPADHDGALQVKFYGSDYEAIGGLLPTPCYSATMALQFARCMARPAGAVRLHIMDKAGQVLAITDNLPSHTDRLASTRPHREPIVAPPAHIAGAEYTAHLFSKADPHFQSYGSISAFTIAAAVHFARLAIATHTSGGRGFTITDPAGATVYRAEQRPHYLNYKAHVDIILYGKKRNRIAHYIDEGISCPAGAKAKAMQFLSEYQKAGHTVARCMVCIPDGTTRKTIAVYHNDTPTPRWLDEDPADIFYKKRFDDWAASFPAD